MVAEKSSTNACIFATVICTLCADKWSTILSGSHQKFSAIQINVYHMHIKLTLCYLCEKELRNCSLNTFSLSLFMSYTSVTVAAANGSSIQQKWKWTTARSIVREEIQIIIFHPPFKVNYGNFGAIRTGKTAYFQQQKHAHA